MENLSGTIRVSLLVALFLTACLPSAPATTSKTASPSASPSPPPTRTPTSTAPPTAASSEVADVLFYHGTILTMETDHPTAQAIALQGAKILAIGSDDDVLAYRGPATQTIDLQGHTLMPGFVDAHSHLFNDAATAGLDMDQAQQQALEYGITTFADMFVTEEFLAEMRAYEQDGNLRLRTSLYLAYTDPCGTLYGDWYKQYPPTRTPGEMLRIGGVKMFADGGVCGKAALSTGYPGGGNGDLWFTQEALNRAVAEAQKAGYQVAIHAQGDLAIEQAQNAIAFALDGKPNTYRHRIEHNPFARPDLLPRYSEIGIVPTAFGEYPTCAEVNDHLYSAYFGDEPMPWLENWHAFLDANPDLPVAWHSDFPYAALNPIRHLYSYVTRAEVAEDGTICEPPDWLATHRITVDEALPMMTIHAAYALFRDEEVGSLKAGKYADLIILSDDPTTIAPNDLINLQVWMTMVGGKVEYCAEGHADLCPQTETGVSPAPETGDTGVGGQMLDFNVEGESLNLGTINQLENIKVNQGLLQMTSTGDDPYFDIPLQSPVLAESTPIIEIRMRVSGGKGGQVFFAPENGILSEENSLWFELFTDGEFHTYTLDFSSLPDWTGTISEIRLDPTDAPGNIEIDYISISPPRS